METEANQLPDTKPCPFCAEPIRQNARKCVHCWEYLDQDQFGFRNKTLWDFFSLLVVPISLVILGSMITIYQGNRERVESRAITERQGIDTILAQYKTEITLLLAKQDPPDRNTRNVIRSRTVDAVNKLDSDGNAEMINFLRGPGVLNWVFTPFEIDKPSFKLLIVNLSEAKLSEVNLSGVNLSAVNMSGADLSEADLSGAGLSGANLSDANLSHANLSRADLSAAEPSKDDPFRATQAQLQLSLTGANLTGADLTETTFYQTRYDSLTTWPDEFDKNDANAAGAIEDE